MNQSEHRYRDPDDLLVRDDSGTVIATDGGAYILLEDPDSKRLFAIGTRRASFRFENWNGSKADITQSGIVERDLDQVRLHEVRDYDSVEGIDALEEMFDSARQDQ